MRDERKVSFLEKMVTSVATGAACGAISAKCEAPKELRDAFTGAIIDNVLLVQEAWKDRDKKGYFNY